MDDLIAEMRANNPEKFGLLSDDEIVAIISLRRRSSALEEMGLSLPEAPPHLDFDSLFVLDVPQAVCGVSRPLDGGPHVRTCCWRRLRSIQTGLCSFLGFGR